MLTGKWENPSHISAHIGLLKPGTRTIAWQETLQRGEKTLEPPGAVSIVILHWHPSSEPKGLRSKSLGGLREAHALLLLVLHTLFIFCKFHIIFFVPELRRILFTGSDTQSYSHISVSWVFAVYIPGTNPWWTEAEQGLYPGHSSLFRWLFWLQCVIPACLRIVFLCERLEDWIPGLSICLFWLRAKLLLASKRVENLFLLFCQCKVLGKYFYLEYPFNSN